MEPAIIKESAGILILEPQEETMEYALRFNFPATNNEAEYEAMIIELRLVKSMGVEELLIDQIRGSCGLKNEILIRYQTKAVEISQEFKRIIFEHIPRDENEMSRLATTYYSELPEGVYVEVCDQPAYREEVVKSIVGSNSMDWRDPIIEYFVQGRLPNNTLEAKKVQNQNFKYQMY
ncbi:hypothetical protein LIER_29888 [Lithospermum erythrorhizon]|uniref:RNase H type-1 domain-containing protein n=1 Tax=Lithospermum erythrorhizon TaxID=34254 RepID=A0AAV3RMJ6_LITER